MTDICPRCGTSLPTGRPLPKLDDGYDDRLMVGAAIRSVWAFAPGREHTISREQAAAVLRWWKHFDELHLDEIEAILRRFPPERELIEHGNSGPGGPLREVDSDE